MLLAFISNILNKMLPDFLITSLKVCNICGLIFMESLKLYFKMALAEIFTISFWFD